MKGVWETVRHFLNLHVKLKQNVVIAYKPQLPAPSYGKFGGSLTTMFWFILFLCVALGSLGFFPFRCLLVFFSVFFFSVCNLSSYFWSLKLHFSEQKNCQAN